MKRNRSLRGIGGMGRKCHVRWPKYIIALGKYQLPLQLVFRYFVLVEFPRLIPLCSRDPLTGSFLPLGLMPRHRRR